MSIELIMRRRGQKEFEKMMVIWRFCEERFGKPNYLNTWDGDFADDTDEYIAFKFWDESMATYLKLTHPELMSREEFDNKDYV